jgi:4-amino-4-deoxy-L-arabinose transferase-like glycosyltransferase
MNETPFWRRPGFVAGVLILATSLVRWWFLASDQLDLVQDEAQYWDWTRRLQLSYYSKGPLIAYIIHTWTSLFGDTELGVRFGALAGSFLSQTIIYLGVSRLFRRPWTGVWTLVVANTAPLFMASGLLMTTDNPLVVCWAAALFSLLWASMRERPALPLLFLGLAVALGVMAKYVMLAFLPVAAVYLYGLHRNGLLRPGLLSGAVAALVLGAAAGMAPIVAWNAGNDWVGFRHVGALAGVDDDPLPLLTLKTFAEFAGAQVGMVTPWWFVFMLVGGWRALKNCFRRPPEAPAPTAVFGQDARLVRESWLLAAGFWPIFAGFLLFSLHADKAYPNWPAVCYVAGLVLAGRAFHRFWERRGRLRALWPALGLAVFLLLHAQNWVPLPDHLNPALRLKGWEDLGNELARLEISAFDDPERVFYFADSYDMTASLAFYAPDQPRAYCADFGRRMNQYDLWPGPRDKQGWDAVMVDKRFKGGPPDELLSMFQEVEMLHYQTEHRGTPARRFTIFLCRGFNGRWPSHEPSTY